MHRLSLLATCVAMVSMVYSSCTQQPAPNSAKEPVPPVMREVSELVTLMFEIEAGMKSIRQGLVEDSTFTQLKESDFRAIFTAEASKHIKRDAVFDVNATAYLKKMHKLANSNNRDSALVYYNDAISACVTCHEGHCPGPVARIEKLRIN